METGLHGNTLAPQVLKGANGKRVRAQMEAARKEAGSAEVAAKPAKRTWVGWMMGEAAPGKGKAAEEGEGEGQLRSDLTPEEVAQLQEMAAEQQDALQSGTFFLYFSPVRFFCTSVWYDFFVSVRYDFFYFSPVRLTEKSFAPLPLCGTYGRPCSPVCGRPLPLCGTYGRPCRPVPFRPVLFL